MRIAYLNSPCLANETCFHGRCIHVDDFLIGWYEFCRCHRHYSGEQCNEQTKFNQIDWFILSTCLITCLSIALCLFCLPYCYRFFQEDFYPQIIECTRSRPYVEVNSVQTMQLTGVRIFRIPSEHLQRRRTMLDGLIPLHSIASLAYLRVPRRDERIHR